ncbi:MAG: CarD family transcriptional regulator [Candidatus Carbobacillus altaicus]|uniref:CarD-like transcriptional regulator n=1 Tax=Candidatus Carbonibacillus altaicus TaxID=2163959 RepID=A0A2R6XZT6_9BACL|nr:CarD family transcriptional regulator [Candidatus Carbobacillus altaicus]PTQ55937.1 MAG: CarD-like transcriptional regulator [Candidatus Carbobacillus altaicus]
MFKVGDKVVYPMHGAGVIEAIEEKEFLGERRAYYVLNMPIGEMRVMIPLEHMERLGLREVLSADDFQALEEALEATDAPSDKNWNQRYRAHMEKMKSGDALAVAVVVRNLMRREKIRGLSTGERRMLDSARQILISEIALAKNLKADEAEAWVEKRVLG